MTVLKTILASVVQGHDNPAVSCNITNLGFGVWGWIYMEIGVYIVNFLKLAVSISHTGRAYLQDIYSP